MSHKSFQLLAIAAALGVDMPTLKYISSAIPNSRSRNTGAAKIKREAKKRRNRK